MPAGVFSCNNLYGGEICLTSSYVHVQEVMSIIGCDRGKMTSHVPALLLSYSPEQLLLAPEVALTILLLPAKGAVGCAGVFLATDTFCSKIVV